MINTMGVLRRLNGYHGAEVYLVGGFVRDLIRRKRNDDIDVVVKKLKPSMIKMFLNRYGTAKYANLTFGVPIILFKAFGDRSEAQITLPRDLKGNFRPGNSLKQDAECRDFTINAMYLPVGYRSKKDVIDFFGGYRDIKMRIIRAVKDPDRRINESPIRMLRAVSLAARTRYRIDKDVMHAIVRNRNLIKDAPVESVREELNEIFVSAKPSTYLKVMQKTGLLEIILPELSKCAGVRQDKKYHKFDVFKHCLYTCDYIEPSLVLRLSAVLHDIGKPDTKDMHGERTTFHKHEVVSARLAKNVLERLRYKKEIIRSVTQLVRMHMYHYTRDFTDAAVRRFIKRAGITANDLENIENIPLFKIRKAERKGNGFKTIPITERQRDFETRIKNVFKGSKGFEIEDLDIDGKILMKLFNLESGPKVGDTLTYLLDKILESPKLNTRKELIKLSAEYIYYKM